MPYCSKCGVHIDDDAKFCPECGAAVAGAGEKSGDTFGEKAGKAFNDFNNTDDLTSSFDEKDISDNKAMAILAYFGILVLIPLFGAKNSRFAQFHANQGLVLFIASAIVTATDRIFNDIFTSIAFAAAGLFLFVIFIIGIVNASKGLAKKLPLIGEINIIKFQ